MGKKFWVMKYGDGLTLKREKFQEKRRVDFLIIYEFVIRFGDKNLQQKRKIYI